MEKQAIQYRRAKTWQIALFTLNNTATNTALFIMSYYAYFTQNILGLAAVVVGAIATATRVFDGITDPIIGFLVDKTNGRFGKFRPFMIGGNIIICACIIGIFNTPASMSVTGRYVYTTALYFIYILGYTCQTVCTKAAQAVLTNDPKQRPLYTGFDTVYTKVVQQAVALLITVILAEKFSVGQYAAVNGGGGSGMLNPAMWRTASLIICAASFTMTILAAIAISEKDKPEFFGELKKTNVKFSDYVDIIKGNRPIQMLIISAATDKLGTMLQTGTAIYVFANLFLNNKLQGVYSSMVLLPSIAAAFCGVALARKLGLKRNFLMGTWGSMTVLIIMFILRPNPDQPYIWLILYVIQGCIVGLANGSIVPMLADCTDYENYRSGRFVPGMIGTMFSFVDKIISSLSGLIVGLALSMVGVGNVQIVPNQPVNPQFNLAIMLCFCGVPILGHIASIISMKFYFLTGTKMEEIQKEISMRNAKA